MSFSTIKPGKTECLPWGHSTYGDKQALNHPLEKKVRTIKFWYPQVWGKLPVTLLRILSWWIEILEFRRWPWNFRVRSLQYHNWTQNNQAQRNHPGLWNSSPTPKALCSNVQVANTVWDLPSICQALGSCSAPDYCAITLNATAGSVNAIRCQSPWFLRLCISHAA